MAKAGRLITQGNRAEALKLLEENGIDIKKFNRWYKRNQQGAYQGRLKSISKEVRQDYLDFIE